MRIFGFSPGVFPTELRNLVFSLEYLGSNGRQVLLEGIRLGGSATLPLRWVFLGQPDAQVVCTGRVRCGDRTRQVAASGHCLIATCPIQTK